MLQSELTFMTVTTEMKTLLFANGWTIEHDSPLTLKHHDGSMATFNAAQMLLQALSNLEELKRLEQNMQRMNVISKLGQRLAKDETMSSIWSHMCELSNHK